jgi:hypothetical protein
MINLFSEGIGNLLRGDDLLLQESLEDLVSAAFQILVGFLVEVTMFTDQIDQKFFL